MKVCLVEDNDLLRGMLCDALKDEGIDITAVTDAEELDQKLHWHSFDAFVLDLNLPGEDGLSIAQRLKKAQPSCFVVMATARERVSDRISGYEHGADVYMTKPVHVRELVAVLRAGLKKQAALKPAERGVSLFLANAHIQNALLGSSARLTSAEYLVLRALVLANGHFLEHWELFDLLGKQPDAKAKRIIEVHILNIRKKIHQLGVEGPSIKAIRGRGYQLTVPIELS